MDKKTHKCPDCGCEEVIEGELVSTGGVVFRPLGQRGFLQKTAFVKAVACKKCGTVYNLKLTNKPCKLTD